MKYIMFERKYMGVTQRTPIIFPDYLVHYEIAQAIMIMNPEFVPVSAGSVNVDVEVRDESSISLKLKPHKDDQMNIQTHDYLHGLS